MQKSRKYRLLANTVVAIHILFIASMIVLVPLAFIYDWAIYVNLSAAILVFIGNKIWGGCICTVWQKHYLSKDDSLTVYKGGFVPHYLKKKFGITVSQNLVINVVKLLVIALILATLLKLLS